MLICGLDEAGRGSVFGNLCIGCCVMEQNTEYDAKDSKKLSAKKRNLYFDRLKEKAVEMNVLEITPIQLNQMHHSGMTLNEIEVWGFTTLLNSLENKPDLIVLDSCDVNEERFGRQVCNGLDYECEQIISLHKADEKYKIAGAASIIAKTYREKNVDELKSLYGTHIGSGYPSDKKSIQFLSDYYKEHKRFPDETRLFWSTIDKIKQKIDHT